MFNIPRRNEDVATDTVMSDTPAVDDGSTMAQFFVGKDTLVCDSYGIKSQKQFINTLADNVSQRGAMNTLISDGGSYEISKKVTDFLRSLLIADYQSEPYHQCQNKAEQWYGTANHWTNTIITSVAIQHPVGYSASNMYVSCSTSQLLSLLKVSARFKHYLAKLQTPPSSSTSIFMSLSTTGWIMMNQIMPFLLPPMRRKAIGLVLLRTLETD